MQSRRRRRSRSSREGVVVGRTHRAIPLPPAVAIVLLGMVIRIRRIQAFVEQLGIGATHPGSRLHIPHHPFQPICLRCAICRHARKMIAVRFAQPGGISPRGRIFDAGELRVYVTPALFIWCFIWRFWVRQELQFLGIFGGPLRTSFRCS